MSTRSSLRSPGAIALGDPIVRLLVVLLLCIGCVSRALPFFDRDGRLLRELPTEDGYLMLTIARNAALGHGLSTADGTIPTNGTQPFATFVYSLGFRLVGGDKTAGVALALALQFIAAALGAWLVFRLGLRLCAGDARGRSPAALAAAAWFANVLGVMHGMNCLETGFLAALVLAFALALLGREGDPLAPWPARRALGLGVLLGLVLWVRLDAVFLVAAVCATRLFVQSGKRLGADRVSLRSALVTGITAIAVISPWLVHNQLGFGSFMPISGQAESFAAGLGANLAQIPASLTEHVLVVLPIPATLEQQPLVIAACTGLLAVAMALLVRRQRGFTPSANAIVWVVGIQALLLCAYYGFFFGAPYFVGRYLYPLSPFLALAWAHVVIGMLERARLRWAQIAVAAALVVVVAYPNVRLYRKGADHMHFQVVEWVRSHVAEDEWVGAVQTGTVGFFHDRTINLDGKVNPEALEAVLQQRIPAYVLSKPIRYLADWAGLSEWAKIPEIAAHFELIVEDREKDLAVLRRRD